MKYVNNFLSINPTTLILSSLVSFDKNLNLKKVCVGGGGGGGMGWLGGCQQCR